MSTFLSLYTIGKKKDMFELSLSSGRHIYGSKPKYIKSICTRASQCCRGVSGKQHDRYSLVMLVLRMLFFLLCILPYSVWVLKVYPLMWADTLVVHIKLWCAIIIFYRLI